jgi:hypothetical protein
MLDHLVHIRKHSALEETEEPETEPGERILTVLNLTEGLALTEAGVKAFVDADGKEQPAASVRQGIMRTKKFLRTRSGLWLDRFQCFVSVSLLLDFYSATCSVQQWN